MTNPNLCFEAYAIRTHTESDFGTEHIIADPSQMRFGALTDFGSTDDGDEEDEWMFEDEDDEEEEEGEGQGEGM
jgi:hypothetical protein